MHSTSPFRSCAVLHKMMNPEDPRTVDELETYYIDITLASSVSQAIRAGVAKQEAATAMEQASITSRISVRKSSP